MQILVDHGWEIARGVDPDAKQGRSKPGHRILKKGNVRQALYVHDKEIASQMVRKVAKRFGVPQEAFFRPSSVRVKTPGIKLGPASKSTTESPKIPISEGPMAGNTRLIFLPVSTIQIDHRYQRPLNAAWARELANHWDDRMMGIFTVSEREDGFYLLEGQHRQAALLSRGEGHRPVPCLAWKGLSLKEEADIYLGRNTVKLSTTLALFHAKLASGDKAAGEIHRVVTEIYGFKIGQGGKKAISSVGALSKLQSWGVLSAAFYIANQAWGDKEDLDAYFRGPVLLALGAMQKFYGKLLDQKRLALQIRPFTAGELNHMAQARVAGRSAKSGASYIVIVDIMRTLYNHRMKDRALPVADITTHMLEKWRLPQ